MKSLLLSTILAGSLMATPLIQEAKKAGLQPIPSNQKELLKLIDNPKNPITKEKVELGKQLYFDPRLSKSERVSCNTCHGLEMAGVDGIPVSTGFLARHNPHHLNSPTVYNAVFFQRQFWDGRVKTLEAQAQGPMQASFEMASTPKRIETVVKSIPEYVQEFRKAYGEKPITFSLIADTIALFERTLVTPAPYDKFLEGDKNALTKVQKKGLQTFISKGCVSCHSGVALGGDMQPFGIIAPYEYANIGDFKGDKNGLVKVPTLRNIVETPPYFHNGAEETLKDAINEMARIQLGIKLSDTEVYNIEQFFQALTGKKPPMVLPQLPVSTINTPAPQFK